jgi:glycosyltransferase involved in cell wall biosynthesis
VKLLIRRAQEIIAREGLGVFFQRVTIRIKALFGISFQGNYDRGYQHWLKKQVPPLSVQQLNKLCDGLRLRPVFSLIVPVYNVEPRWLQQAVDSVKNQSYPHWQLCIVDDASTNTNVTEFLRSVKGSDDRIQIEINDHNQGIALTSSTALKLATGEFIGLLDHDDLLARDALLFNAIEINRDPEVDLLYSDEDKVSPQGKRSSPFFKPDYSPQLLHSQNYIGHFVVARKSIVDQVGGFRPGYDGAQDFDLLLRITSRTRAIKHIPKILYHWREIPGSTATVFGSKSYAHEKGRLALENSFSQSTINADVDDGVFPGTYRTTYQIQENPLVSIVLPFKDQPQLLDQCLESVFSQTRWKNIEVIAIDNNSMLPETREIIAKWQPWGPTVRFLKYSRPFNYSTICNFGAAKASGEFIVLLNSDIKITSSDWIESMLSFAQLSDVGAVGAKLFYPDQTIQHAGIVVGIDDGAGHPYKNFPASHRGYYLRLGLAHNVTAVTGALLMVSKQKFEDVGGLDEIDFGVAYNDVDFCLKLMEAGYRTVLNPHCQAIHYESMTRGYDLGSQNQSRHDAEKIRLHQKWQAFFDSGDPYYNPNLTLAREDYSLNFEKPTA